MNNNKQYNILVITLVIIMLTSLGSLVYQVQKSSNEQTVVNYQITNENNGTNVETNETVSELSILHRVYGTYNCSIGQPASLIVGFLSPNISFYVEAYIIQPALGITQFVHIFYEPTTNIILHYVESAYNNTFTFESAVVIKYAIVLYPTLEFCDIENNNTLTDFGLTVWI